MSCDSSYCSVLSRSLCCQGVRISLAGEKPPNLRPWYPQLLRNETNVQWWVSVCSICQYQCRCQSLVSCWLRSFAYVLAVVWHELMMTRSGKETCKKAGAKLLARYWNLSDLLLVCFFVVLFVVVFNVGKVQLPLLVMMTVIIFVLRGQTRDLSHTGRVFIGSRGTSSSFVRDENEWLQKYCLYFSVSTQLFAVVSRLLRLAPRKIKWGSYWWALNLFSGKKTYKF